MTSVVVLFALATPASAAIHPTKALVQQRLEHESEQPMYRDTSACWKKRQPIAMTHLAAKVFRFNHTNPGAGIGDLEEQEGWGTVMKDGYSKVGCIKDYMYHHGDKTGGGRHEYEIGERANVSIVHYKALVPKEDQKPMTATVCFEFCRTVPDMQFFGLLAGRECYCDPYFQQMAGDSSKCDAVCEGSPTTMCGGMEKSSIFEMHFCDDTSEDLQNAIDKATDLLAETKPLAKEGMSDANRLQDAAETGQKNFGSAGDVAMGDLMQDAKVFAGELENAVKPAMKLAEELEDATKKAKDIKKDGGFTDPEKMKKAEEQIKKVGMLMEALEAQREIGMDLHELASGMTYTPQFALNRHEGERLKQYKNIMYFVDREFEEMPSTCGGESVKKPIIAESAQDCAGACDAEGNACVGFSYVAVKGPKEALCFLFSKFKSVAYYTECESFLQIEDSDFVQKSASFLQRNSTDDTVQERKHLRHLIQDDLRHLKETSNVTVQQNTTSVAVKKPKKKTKKVWIAEGCTKEKAPSIDFKSAPKKIKVDETASVRCCSSADRDAKCESKKVGCAKGKTYKEAKEVCAKHNMQLCTRQQLESQICCGSGCNFDSKLIWTSEEAYPNPPSMCFAKFASFTGTSLKPDPSGKCDLCLKKAEKFQRCYE